MKDRIEIECPCCATKIVADTDSGDVLSHERPKADTDASFDAALSKVRSGSREREDAFSKAFDRTQRQNDLLSKKFEEAKKKAAKEKGRPKSPFDLD